MIKTRPIIAILIAFALLSACAEVSEGLGGTKKKDSDEFLVKKKSPLVVPPSFGELPEPRKIEDEDLELDKEINLIIDQNSSKDVNTKNDDLNKSIEKSIIEKINEQ